MSDLRIYKYEILPGKLTLLPTIHKFLKVHAQGETLQLWAEVNPSHQERIPVEFIPVPTGGSPPPSKSHSYIDSVFINSGLGMLVFHIYGPRMYVEAQIPSASEEIAAFNHIS